MLSGGGLTPIHYSLTGFHGRPLLKKQAHSIRSRGFGAIVHSHPINGQRTHAEEVVEEGTLWFARSTQGSTEAW